MNRDISELSLYEQVREDFLFPYENDPALKSKIEIVFNYPGIWAIINYRISNRLYKKGFKLLSRVWMGISQVFTNIDIHPAANIGRRVFIDHGIGVVIGETAIIGNDVLIYQGVTLGGVSLDQGKRHPTIGNGVVIGSGAKVLGNITIGEHTKIGANSVVVKDVPAHCTAVGIPAKVVKRRDDSQHSHNKLPDLDKEMFEYLLKKVALLEHALGKCNIEIIEQEKDLDKIYEEFVKAMKE
jgi:serine O-acetyltransferase